MDGVSKGAEECCGWASEGAESFAGLLLVLHLDLRRERKRDTLEKKGLAIILGSGAPQEEGRLSM